MLLSSAQLCTLFQTLKEICCVQGCEKGTMTYKAEGCPARLNVMYDSAYEDAGTRSHSYTRRSRCKAISRLEAEELETAPSQGRQWAAWVQMKLLGVAPGSADS